jgi:transposase
VFAQLMELLPVRALHRCAARYGGDRKVRTLRCLDQFLALAFAQLTYRESLRDVCVCLEALGGKRYHMGLRAPVKRSTLADANERRDWRIFRDFAELVIAQTRPLYANEPLDLALQESVYALDATLIRLCRSVFPWATYRQTTAGIKLHTVLDLRGALPTIVRLSPGRVNDMTFLKQIVPEPGAIYVMDRGYMDFAGLYRFTQAQAFFIVRAKRNLTFEVRRRRRRSDPAIRADLTIQSTVLDSVKAYPRTVRAIRYVDPATTKEYRFLTNNFQLPARTIAELYRQRWQIELFFRWIKQHLRIKAFYGESENAVYTQVWIALTVYVLVAKAKKHYASPLPLYTILQILSISLGEKVELQQLLTPSSLEPESPDFANQLSFFNF